MRVLVACETSQMVTTAFRNKGHMAYSCDINMCQGNHPEWHKRRDVLEILNPADRSSRWDLVIAFPPCTHLCVSGAKHFKEKQADGRQEQAIRFFSQFIYCDCEKVAIENPIGIMSSYYRQPDQVIQPFWFGDPIKKSTCLWLKNLPLLMPTNIVSYDSDIGIDKHGREYSKWFHNMTKSNRANNRSRTFPGIAEAMAEQWG